MNINQEELLEELESVKHCIEMTHGNIKHKATQKMIISVLDKRIAQLQDQVDAAIATQEMAGDPFEVA